MFEVREAVMEAADLNDLTTGEDSMLRELLDMGDQQKAAQLISTVSSLLNSQTQQHDQTTVTKQQRKLVSL